MNTNRNQFMDNDYETADNFLTYSLNSGDSDDNNKIKLLKHSACYMDNKFSYMLSSPASLTIISSNI